MKSVKIFLLLLFLLITSLLIVIPVRAGILNESKLVGKIQDFKAADAPYDDGTGIVLSWIPLPRELRIIQYRIYRGIHPDTLFYFGQVDVDPVAGVAAERMYYYDKDYQSLLSIDSPAKLKKEKHQNDKSSLYAAVPRDPAIIKKLLPYFSVLGVYDAGNFFKRSVMIKNTDGTVSAGLKVTHFEQLAANPNPDTRYYYTVLAVNEKGNFLPYADIRSAIPVDNPPDTSSKLSSVFLTDIQEFRFEWITSISSFDIAQWQFWLLPKSLLPAFEQWQDVYLNNNGAPAPWTAKAILLTEKPNDYSNYLTLTLQNSRV
ncbi:MAG: hypothetical protein FJ041_01520, partial [Candidatus Cloacimonetes bacterium]|nr:hypothetical protein [Candidatus Cloacimonadota bacterium]